MPKVPKRKPVNHPHPQLPPPPHLMYAPPLPPPLSIHEILIRKGYKREKEGSTYSIFGAFSFGLHGSTKKRTKILNAVKEEITAGTYWTKIPIRLQKHIHNFPNCVQDFLNSPKAAHQIPFAAELLTAIFRVRIEIIRLVGPPTCYGAPDPLLPMIGMLQLPELKFMCLSKLGHPAPPPLPS